MMAEVLWPYMRWPLHSRTRFLGCLLALAFLAVVGAQARPAPEVRIAKVAAAMPSVQPAVVVTSRSTGVATRSVPRPTAWPSSTPQATAEVANVALRFVQAWARPEEEARRWREGMADLVHPAFLQLLKRSNPAEVPASAVPGPAALVAAGPAVREYVVLTDVGTVRVTLVKEDGRWQVSAIAAPELRPSLDASRSPGARTTSPLSTRPASLSATSTPSTTREQREHARR